MFPAYLRWHYGRALISLSWIWGNLLWFLYYFFSIPVLFSTWIAPWRRLDESYSDDRNLSEKGETLIVNLLMRVVGFILRSFMLAFGLLACFLVAVLFVPAFLLWLLWPLLILFLFIDGIVLILL